MDSPEDLLDQIESRDDFLRFLDVLGADCQAMEAGERKSPSSPFGSPRNGWENTRLAAFLEAMGAWARDSRLGEAPSWRAFAQLLLAGKGYE
jgi:hypothetical protein